MAVESNQHIVTVPLDAKRYVKKITVSSRSKTRSSFSMNTNIQTVQQNQMIMAAISGHLVAENIQEWCSFFRVVNRSQKPVVYRLLRIYRTLRPIAMGDQNGRKAFHNNVNTALIDQNTSGKCLKAAQTQLLSIQTLTEPLWMLHDYLD